MGIGGRIKEARERKGLTQEELGRLVGVTGSAITNYEKNTSHPKEPVLYALFDVLEVDANFLFQDCVKIKKPSLYIGEDEERLLKLLSQLNQEGREKVLEYADDLVRTGKYIKSYPDQLGQEA